MKATFVEKKIAEIAFFYRLSLKAKKNKIMYFLVCFSGTYSWLECFQRALVKLLKMA